MKESKAHLGFNKIPLLLIKRYPNYNPSQNIWYKAKKYSKIGQDFKNVISILACFFDSCCQSLISGRKTGY